MLTLLKIKNIALIDELAIEFGDNQSLTGGDRLRVNRSSSIASTLTGNSSLG
ncbi:MAG: hypothetical protein IPO41_16780 [Acidobacteria bacterium]|nr:hypothetical protein [Acidobacteriota bacterium]